MPPPMHLRILLPFRVFADTPGVTRIVAETKHGSFGFLPRRLDCTAALSPGIFTYATEGRGETYLAIDEGVLVKAGTEVLVCVRNAIGGADLGRLREAVEREFLGLDERETSARAAMAKLESGFIHRFAEFRHA